MNIKHTRYLKGISQGDLTKATQVHQSYLARYECYGTTLQTRHKHAIEKYMGMRIDWGLNDPIDRPKLKELKRFIKLIARYEGQEKVDAYIQGFKTAQEAYDNMINFYRQNLYTSVPIMSYS